MSTETNANSNPKPADNANAGGGAANTSGSAGAGSAAGGGSGANGNGAMKRRRWVWLSIFGAGVLLIGAAYTLYWATVLRYRQTTDDAYVNGNVVQITPQISGTVVSIGADDTQFVKAGQTLVRLDPADAKVALDQAEAQLARTVRDVRNVFAVSGQLRAAVQLRQSDLDMAQKDLARRERLSSSGAISNEELTHARDAVRGAQAGLLSAQQQLAANQARIDGTTLEDHPDVKSASANVRNAYLNYSRTELPAPVSGFVARRNVQLGQRVSPGSPLMAVVPLDQVWVDANFKEPQLARMRVGQSVDLTADLYGGNVTYHGKVSGFGAGTGSAFALLPAQNATGNWIKIVQRVPVRIALDPHEMAQHPLQIGLSMKVEVGVRNVDGERLPELAQTNPAYATDVFHSPDEKADARVREIIAANDLSNRTDKADTRPPGASVVAQAAAGGAGGAGGSGARASQHLH
jgi:membrane fusion protein, multidrug efflux system